MYRCKIFLYQNAHMHMYISSIHLLRIFLNNTRGQIDISYRLCMMSTLFFFFFSFYSIWLSFCFNIFHLFENKNKNKKKKTFYTREIFFITPADSQFHFYLFIFFLPCHFIIFHCILTHSTIFIHILYIVYFGYRSLYSLYNISFGIFSS